jgi:hypothetical protein
METFHVVSAIKRAQRSNQFEIGMQWKHLPSEVDDVAPTVLQKIPYATQFGMHRAHVSPVYSILFPGHYDVWKTACYRVHSRQKHAVCLQTTNANVAAK